MPYPRRVRAVSFLCLVCALLIQIGVPLQAADQADTHTGFRATITGSYEGKVSGKGTLVLLPEAGFERKGYFFLADGQGVRPHGVTFVLPRGVVKGIHPLRSFSPLDIGKFPSVRVDRDTGGVVRSADSNISGFLELEAFPETEWELGGSDVRGNFEFETESATGERITVKGDFSFKVK